VVLRLRYQQRNRLKSTRSCSHWRSERPSHACSALQVAAIRPMHSDVRCARTFSLLFSLNQIAYPFYYTRSFRRPCEIRDCFTPSSARNSPATEFEPRRDLFHPLISFEASSAPRPGHASVHLISIFSPPASRSVSLASAHFRVSTAQISQLLEASYSSFFKFLYSAVAPSLNVAPSIVSTSATNTQNRSPQSHLSSLVIMQACFERRAQSQFFENCSSSGDRQSTFGCRRSDLSTTYLASLSLLSFPV